MAQAGRALEWLTNFDARRDEIEGILRNVYGNDTALRMRRWRWFLLATAGLFGYANGSERQPLPDEGSGLIGCASAAIRAHPSDNLPDYRLHRHAKGVFVFTGPRAPFGNSNHVESRSSECLKLSLLQCHGRV